MGMPGTGTLERAALAMGTITDTRGEDWVPVQKCVLKDLFQNIRDLQRRAAERTHPQSAEADSSPRGGAGRGKPLPYKRTKEGKTK